MIDAYAAVLSLDAATLPTPSRAPIRLAILDLNNDGRFDERDVSAFLGLFLDSDGNPVQPASRDYLRFDLNGDGFTGGSNTEQFDLDRIRSAQYGATNDAPDVTQEIDGTEVHFDSNAVYRSSGPVLLRVLGAVPRVSGRAQRAPRRALRPRIGRPVDWDRLRRVPARHA